MRVRACVCTRRWLICIVRVDCECMRRHACMDLCLYLWTTADASTQEADDKYAAHSRHGSLGYRLSVRHKKKEKHMALRHTTHIKTRMCLCPPAYLDVFRMTRRHV